MSCSYVLDPPPEKSDSLVILLNNDRTTVSVDPETLRQTISGRLNYLNQVYSSCSFGSNPFVSERDI